MHIARLTVVGLSILLGGAAQFGNHYEVHTQERRAFSPRHNSLRHEETGVTRRNPASDRSRHFARGFPLQT
jgi:hypothetical protein